jgi:hypothetical protein
MTLCQQSLFVFGWSNYKWRAIQFHFLFFLKTLKTLAECHGDKLERSNVLYCSYCLSEDQRWLLAACTDEQGELMETVTINIEIPNR